jgi:hypothetical protein
MTACCLVCRRSVWPLARVLVLGRNIVHWRHRTLLKAWVPL